MPNTFSAKYDTSGEKLLTDVYIQEPQWDVDMQITADLVADSPYIERHDVPESRPLLEIIVKNGHATYEIVNFNPIYDIYTCRLLSGEVYS